MPMYNLLKYSNNYSKTSRSLFQYCRDESGLDNTGAPVNFTNDNTTRFIQIQRKNNRSERQQCTKNVEKIVP